MKLGKPISMAVAAIALASAGVAQATVSYSTIDTPVVEIPSLVDYATTGADMTGLSVTALFSNGLTETLYWQTTGAGTGGVSSLNGWSLGVSGDTYTSTWDFSFSPTAAALTLTKLVLDGTSVYTIFDRSNSGDTGTAGSASGADFWLVDESIGALATYSKLVALTGQAPVGDIWYTLSVDFGNGVSSDFSFAQDTDNVSRSSVPEPATLGLLGLALAGVGFSARRRKAA